MFHEQGDDMAVIPTGSVQFLARFENSTIVCNPYAIAKLGIDSRQCFLKLDEYIILCSPFQLGFKRGVFVASLTHQELSFFQKYVNQMVGLSITFNQGGKEPVKLFLRCNLAQVGQMKGRENSGLIVVDFKSIPEDLIQIFGHYLEQQDLFKVLYEDLAATSIRMTAAVAKLTGYNMYATVSEQGGVGKRIQVYHFHTKMMEHIETGNGPGRETGTALTYQLYFQKYRFLVNGKVVSSEAMQNDIMKITAALDFSPELVEIVDDYWFQVRSNPNALGNLDGMRR
jgi:hypothetical protein